MIEKGSVCLELMNGTAQDKSDGKKQCLAACKDQLNLVTETSSSFPNSQTFHRREEFCLVLHKLSKTCASVKAAAFTDTYTPLCELKICIFRKFLKTRVREPIIGTS